MPLSETLDLGWPEWSLSRRSPGDQRTQAVPVHPVTRLSLNPSTLIDVLNVFERREVDVEVNHP
jgi:hypothetical protein